MIVIALQYDELTGVISPIGDMSRPLEDRDALYLLKVSDEGIDASLEPFDFCQVPIANA